MNGGIAIVLADACVNGLFALNSNSRGSTHQPDNKETYIYNSSIALECSRPPGILRMTISILCLTAQSYCTARVEIKPLIRLSREQLQTVTLHGFYTDPPVRSHCTVVYSPLYIHTA